MLSQNINGQILAYSHLHKNNSFLYNMSMPIFKHNTIFKKKMVSKVRITLMTGDCVNVVTTRRNN